MYAGAQYYLTDSKVEMPEWVSYQKLVQELITGLSRRHTFTAWELEFLLDLQASGMRKAHRESALRRYLRTIHQDQLDGALAPTRLATFLAAENKAQSAPSGKAVAVTGRLFSKST